MQLVFISIRQKHSFIYLLWYFYFPLCFLVPLFISYVKVTVMRNEDKARREMKRKRNIIFYQLVHTLRIPLQQFWSQGNERKALPFALRHFLFLSEKELELWQCTHYTHISHIISLPVLWLSLHKFSI